MSRDSSSGRFGGSAWRRSKQEPKNRSFLRELPLLIGIALVLSLLVKTFLVQAFFIPSESMEQTLHGCAGCTGDRILVDKVSYRFGEPSPGDIVVFRGPSSWTPEAPPPNQGVLGRIGGFFGVPQASEKDFVKRVVAVGGQKVACCDRRGRVTVDGKPLDEPYIYENNPVKERAFGPVTVPEGRLWVMGDHRSASADSRAHVSDQFTGTISVDDVIGKAFIIVWPPTRWNFLGSGG
ncbi:signal peptidase I [Actinomadura alba]|uniref:Signal peptidase I n=1 Tax=Actinomadura alba TaxID=406431 RepID=A0ABR7LXR8_9ACTN|nr:signal peptidase I [Actinomadura alba]MBC6469349.1 signal peptidase I [Actinomadura alba]